MERRRQLHVSQNRVHGSLDETPLERVLVTCRQRMVTGAIDVRTPHTAGAIELRLGVVESARFGTLIDSDALTAMSSLRDGTYELAQRLPDLDGSIGSAAELHARGDVSLVELMRHCEEHALTGTITAIHEFDRGEIEYRTGDIVGVTLNGRRDDDAIVEMVSWPNAICRVQAPPLADDILGWPVTRRAPTAPFTVARAARRLATALPRSTAAVRAMLPVRLPPRRRRAPTSAPPPPARWRDLFWHGLAYTLHRVRDRVADAAPPTPPNRLRQTMHRLRRVTRRLAFWRRPSTRASSVAR